MSNDINESTQKPLEPKPKTMQVGNRTYKETSITVTIMSSEREVTNRELAVNNKRVKKS